MFRRPFTAPTVCHIRIYSLALLYRCSAWIRAIYCHNSAAVTRRWLGRMRRGHIVRLLHEPVGKWDDNLYILHTLHSTRTCACKKSEKTSLEKRSDKPNPIFGAQQPTALNKSRAGRVDGTTVGRSIFHTPYSILSHKL